MNKIAKTRTTNSFVLIFLNDFNVSENSKVIVYGDAELYDKSCWVFPDRVDIL